MSTPINRAPWNALVDDDGSNTIGTPWNKAAIAGVILDPVDAAIAASVSGAVGTWRQAPYNAGDFVSDAGTWTVPQASVGQNIYSVVGNTLIWAMQINGAVIGAGAGIYLAIQMPAGLSGTVTSLRVATATDGNGIAVEALTMNGSPSQVAIRKVNPAGWIAGSTNYVYFTAIVALGVIAGAGVGAEVTPADA